MKPARAALWACLALACLSIPAACADQFFVHSEGRWALDNSRGFKNVTLNDIPIPSYAHEVLQQRGIIGDPLYLCVPPTSL